MAKWLVTTKVGINGTVETDLKKVPNKYKKNETICETMHDIHEDVFRSKVDAKKWIKEISK